MLNLRIQQIQYEFSSAKPLQLHYDIPTITLRGAFGYALAHVIAIKSNILELEPQVELYKSIFCPQNTGDKDSRNHEIARPFIMRGAYNKADKKSFILDVNLFGIATEYENFFDQVIYTIAANGVGKDNQKCNCKKIFSTHKEIIPQSPKPFLKVNFVTPCSKLKSGRQIFTDEIPFYALFARLVDRVNELRNLYEHEDILINNDYTKDYIAYLKQLAKEIEWKKITGGKYQARRTSGRTGQKIYLDGFVGEMGYHGNFVPFQEYLNFLPHINVGRFNVFGCGWTSCEYCDYIY